MAQTGVLPQVTLGRTGCLLSRAGLGGEGVLRTSGLAREAQEVIETALAEGITYFDSARAYEDSEVYYGSTWSRRPKDREHCFITSKSAQRDARGARRDLEETLRRLQVDHLDLWQLHDLRTKRDLDALGAPGGAWEAFVAARDQGLVRHIGVTGHHDPSIITRAVREFPVDTVLLPVNPMEAALGGFFTQTIPAARERGCGVIGMKVLGGARSWGGQGGAYLTGSGLEARELLRYAFAQPVDVLIVGCASPAEVQALVEVARGPHPMNREEQETLVERIRPQAARLAGYRGVIG